MRTASNPQSLKVSRPRAGPVAVAVAALIGFAAGDSCVRPDRQLVAAGAVRTIDAYRATISPFFARTGIVRCRFEPTCSSYAREALSRYGLPRGFFLAAGRVLRCHPFAKGGRDPVP
jgi:uncharacterized protein